MAKVPVKILFGREAKEKMMKGINLLAEAVGSTLGPRSRLVGINNPFTTPDLYRDGVTVARRINLEDPFEDMGAELLKAAAIKTNETAGDGTTVTTILTHAIIKEALQSIAAGVNPMTLKKEIEEAKDRILEDLKKLSKPIKTDEEIEQIATISAADSEIGKMVAEALLKVGKDGIVTVEQGKGLTTTVDYKQGMEIDRGYLSPYFVTDQATVEAIVEEPYILITDKKLNYAHDLVPLVEKLLPISKNLVIFAGEVVEEAMALLVANKIRGAINVVAVQAPAYGGRRVDELEDLAILTGGTAILEDSGRTLDSVEVAELGRAEKIVVDRDKTVIFTGKGDDKAIQARIDNLKDQMKLANTDFDKDIKEQRLAKLAGKVAVINVGATTEIEATEKKERVIDSVNATKAGIEEGVVAGGEITLLELSRNSEGILQRALKAPFKKLMENAGFDYGDIREKMAGNNYPFGVDVTTGEVTDLIKIGIIDPVKVTRSAIENAVSVAVMVITTDALISEVEKKE